MENKRGGSFLKGLLILGVGVAAGYFAAKKLNISLKEDEDDGIWDYCCDEDDDCCCECCESDADPIPVEDAAEAAEAPADDADELKF